MVSVEGIGGGGGGGRAGGGAGAGGGGAGGGGGGGQINSFEEFIFPSDFAGLTLISDMHVVKAKSEYLFLIEQYLRLDPTLADVNEKVRGWVLSSDATTCVCVCVGGCVGVWVCGCIS